MKRITLVLGMVALMAAMMVALAAPAMAKGKGGGGSPGAHHGSPGTHGSPGVHGTPGVHSSPSLPAITEPAAPVITEPAPPVITEPAAPILTNFVDVDDFGFDRANLDFDRGLHFANAKNGKANTKGHRK